MANEFANGSSVKKLRGGAHATATGIRGDREFRGFPVKPDQCRIRDGLHRFIRQIQAPNAP